MKRWVAFLALSLPAAAFAQGAPLGKGRPPPQTFTLTREHHTAAEDTARARFAAGDCKGALDAFDQALQHSADPTLHRDRGICHEKLEQPFPAADDYRAYLAAAPQAKDAEDIQRRLARLEGRAAPQDLSPDDDQKAKVALKGRTLTEVERDRDRKDEASESALRTGRGWAIGALLTLRGINNRPMQFGQKAGATLRWSFDAHSTLMTELGWHWFDADRPSGGNGPFAYLGYEARFQLDDFGTHSLVFGAGGGYERWVVNGLNADVNAIAIRGRGGYRLVLGPAFGLELVADGGPLIAFYGGSKVDAVLNIGGSFAFVVAF